MGGVGIAFLITLVGAARARTFLPRTTPRRGAAHARRRRRD